MSNRNKAEEICSMYRVEMTAIDSHGQSFRPLVEVIEKALDELERKYQAAREVAILAHVLYANEKGHTVVNNAAELHVDSEISKRLNEKG